MLCRATAAEAYAAVLAVQTSNYAQSIEVGVALRPDQLKVKLTPATSIDVLIIQMSCQISQLLHRHAGVSQGNRGTRKQRSSTF